ncbi:MAG TPA: DUF86 domain-containing protein [Thermoanaerobaculia bacterium]|nr:DUF86 domain-containing protein [Thermoanaerobaculia bacterium]
MVKPEVVAQKVTAARTRLAATDEIFGRPLAEFLADVKERDLASFYLQLAIQDCIDLALHWVVDADWGTPPDSGTAFDILRDKGQIEPELAQALRAATALRNRIAHGYGTVDAARLHAEYPLGVQALREFLAAVAGAAGG